MSMEAVGAYLRTLREGHGGMSREAVAEGITPWLGRKFNPSTLFRIEKGEQTPKGDMLAFILDFLGGDAGDVSLLLRSNYATPDDGRDLALARMQLTATDISEFERRRAIAEFRRISAALRR